MSSVQLSELETLYMCPSIRPQLLISSWIFKILSVLKTDILPFSAFILVFILVFLGELAEGFRWDGRGVGENDSTVATRGQNQLVVEVVKTNTPDPENINSI